jgi:hypothetical protein
MKDEEEKNLRQLYGSLSTDELIPIVRDRAEQYDPEALLLVQSELHTRGIDKVEPVKPFSDITPTSMTSVQPGDKSEGKSIDWGRVLGIVGGFVVMYSANVGVIIVELIFIVMLVSANRPSWTFLFYAAMYPLGCIVLSCVWIRIMRFKWLILAAIPSIIIQCSVIWMLVVFVKKCKHVGG